MRAFDLPFSIHEDVGHAPLQYAETSAGETSGMFATGDTPAAGFDADETNAGFVQEFEEGSDGVGAAADAGNDGVRETAFGAQDLLLGLDRDDAMEIADHHRIRVRAIGRAQGCNASRGHW